MKRYVALGLLGILVIGMIASSLLLMFNPEDSDDDKPEEEKEFFGPWTARQLLDDIDEEEDGFRSYDEGDWILIEDKIVRVATESEHPTLDHDMYLTQGSKRYDHIMFVWVESLGSANFTFSFTIAAKNPEDLDILKEGITLVLELEVINIGEEGSEGEFVKGNLKNHPELVYDPSNTTPL